jgi:tRNA A37 methylthiotransferase MiaB
MNFRNFLESIETRYYRYYNKLKAMIPNKDESFYKFHMGQMIASEKQLSSPPEEYNDDTFNDYTHRLMGNLGADFPKGYSRKHTYGQAYPDYPHGTSQDTKKNVWVKHSADPQNHNRILACQFSSPILYSHAPGTADKYYDKLYSGARSGYAHPQDFWEIPRWIAVMSKNLNNVDLYVVRDVAEAVNFFKRAGYKLVCFSVLDINKSKIEQIAQQYTGRIVIGGYADLESFKQYKNVKVYKTMNDFVEDQKKTFQQGTDYRLFKGTEVIPRLCMSTGCKHKCKFCIVSKNLQAMPQEAIEQEAEALAQLNSKLVYLDDKTFGQAENYILLPQIYEQVVKRNPHFEGFVIQTTASEVSSNRRLTPDFMRKAHIRYVELGIESYNDEILAKYHKPAREKIIDSAVNAIRQGGALLIPNIIIGFPEETEQTYQKTLEWIKRNKDVISHINVYNLAVYSDAEIAKTLNVNQSTDADENNPAKSFHADPKLHQRFYDEMVNLGIELLNKKPGEEEEAKAA